MAPRVNSRETQKTDGSELAQEVHYVGIIPPLFLASPAAASRVAGGQSFCLNSQICFRIDIRRIQGNMTEPHPDRVQINTSSEQVGCGHLVRAGVDINTIRAWLGRVSVDTTNIYAETDLSTKAKALAVCAPGDGTDKVRRPWRDDPGLIQFLQRL